MQKLRILFKQNPKSTIQYITLLFIIPRSKYHKISGRKVTRHLQNRQGFRLGQRVDNQEGSGTRAVIRINAGVSAIKAINNLAMGE